MARSVLPTAVREKAFDIPLEAEQWMVCHWPIWRPDLMTATILDGKALADEIRAEVAQQTAQFTEQTGVTPCLAAVLVGENPASQVYVRNKQRACQQARHHQPIALPGAPRRPPCSYWA